MVFNVHLLHHTTECVERNGPLFAYSNYNMEDKIGHFVSFVHGTTDVTQQITNKYLMEQRLLVLLDKDPSRRAKQFYDASNTHRFSKVKKMNDHMLIGEGLRILDQAKLEFIWNHFQIDCDDSLVEYKSILLHSRIYYENSDSKKGTCDSFVSNDNEEKFAEINSIFIHNEEIYFLINEKFWPLTTWKNMCEYVIPLKSIPDTLKIVQSSYFGSKYAFIKFDEIIACSKFPNMYERN